MLATINAGLRAIARGIDLPTAITGAVLPGDAFERLFIATQPGEILYQVNGGFDTFLDIGDRVIRLGAGGGGYDERGLLGLAFHPEFRENGLFYLHYSARGTQGPGALPGGFLPDPCRSETLRLSWENRVARYDHVDVVEEWILRGDSPRRRRGLLRLLRPFFNHNGVNSLAFSPETGRLVLVTGDGGAAYDPFNLAQDDGEIAGKVIEIDVDRVPMYDEAPVASRFAELPPDVRAALAVVAKGVRNASGLSYQRAGGGFAKYLGQVGQDLTEAIFAFDSRRPVPAERVARREAPASGGELINFGWRGWEGNLPALLPKGCGNGESQKTVAYFRECVELATRRIPPLASYYHEDPRDGRFAGTALTGVRPYAGREIASLAGKIAFCDYLKKAAAGPARGVLAYAAPRSGIKDNEIGLIDIGDPFGTEAAFFVSLGSNSDHTRLFLGVYATANVTERHRGAVYEIVSGIAI